MHSLQSAKPRNRCAGAKRMRRQPQIHANSLQDPPIAILGLFKEFADKRANIVSGARFAMTSRLQGLRLIRPDLVEITEHFHGPAKRPQTTPGGRPEGALCTYTVENKRSTDPDFHQQLSIGVIEDHRRATLQRRQRRVDAPPATVGDAAQARRRRAPARCGRRPKAIPGHRSGSDSREPGFTEQGSFLWRTGSKRAANREKFVHAGREDLTRRRLRRVAPQPRWVALVTQPPIARVVRDPGISGHSLRGTRSFPLDYGPQAVWLRAGKAMSRAPSSTAAAPSPSFRPKRIERTRSIATSRCTNGDI